MKLIPIAAAVLFAGAIARGQGIPVIDASNLGENVLQYGEEVIQVGKQVETIDNQIEQLRRFGDPGTYVSMLDLGDFTAGAANLATGIGEVTETFREDADGAAALGYVANGIYEDLTKRVDRWGDPIEWQTDNFKQYNAVQNTMEALSEQQGTFNQQLQALANDLKTTMGGLNSDGTQMGTEKQAGKLTGLSGEVNAVAHQTSLVQQRAQAMHESNINNQLRVEEANRQQERQERVKDLAKTGEQLQFFISGQGGDAPAQGALP